MSPDRDGDGLADPRENVDCLLTLLFGCVETAVAVPDTDGDKLADADEVDGVRNETFDFESVGTIHSDRGDYFHGRMRNDIVSAGSTTSLIRYGGKESQRSLSGRVRDADESAGRRRHRR